MSSDTLTQKAYEYLHEKLSCGTLLPGSRLSNRGVAKEIGVSFTPVREALSRLVSEGLLEYRQGLGVFVPRMTNRDIQEIYEVREILESVAVAKVCGNLTSGVLETMTNSYRRMTDIYEQVQSDPKDNAFTQHAIAWQTADSEFHLALLYAAGNRRLLNIANGLQTSLHIMSSIRNQPTLVLHRFLSNPRERLKRTLDEHRLILEAIQQNDPSKAQERITAHIRNGLRLALEDQHHSHMNREKG